MAEIKTSFRGARSFLDGDGSSSDPNPSCVPPDSLSQAAHAVARSELHLDILNHSLRTFVYAVAISEREDLPWHEQENLPLLFTAAIFHDMGTTTSCDGPQRFEVEGADAAVSFLNQHEIPEAKKHEVWVAIAVHTCSGIAERISTLARAIRLAVLVDFKRSDMVELLGSEMIDQVEQVLPRGAPEKVLGDAVVEQATRQPTTWPGQLARSTREHSDWQGVNKEF
ncbi:uncharacterized protein LTR77_008577 [Saxophila tyrrhenica]|uniref:HD domain-containing protein n=1 Tax=Saxophila tyrrhenica TaxID=1690608 RepID=A0AAV9P247_9PEZI|nr:hypothetical protein LTR77_008577 [Saxophila tyrrhenica]